MPTITVRSYAAHDIEALINHGVHPVLARVYAARGIGRPAQLETDLSHLIPFGRLKNVSVAQ